MKNIREKTIEVLNGMKQGSLEREEALALSLLSAMAGESTFLLGLPGVGKSMIARRLKSAFKDATVFEYLMSRFSTPDEIFGPVSISKLKDEDRYERVTSGFLPEADVVFLDEIWKAGPAIQNALLTVLNEKIFLNGNHEISLPLKGIIAASNELPAEDEGLEALWDRFLIRYLVEPIEKPENFKRLLLLDPAEEYHSTNVQFTKEDYTNVMGTIGSIELPEPILECILELHEKMRSKANHVDRDTGEVPEENSKYYISDRRWRKCVGILRTSACLNGRKAVDFSDLPLLSHMLWNDESSIDEIRHLTAETIVSAVFKRIIDDFKSPKRHATSKKSTEPTLYSPDGNCYIIESDGSPLRIRKSDYETLQKDPKGIYFASETTDGYLFFSDGGQFCIQLEKKGVLKINGYTYPIRSVADKELDLDFIEETEDIFETTMNNLFRSIERNLFTSNSKAFLAIQAVTDIYRKRFNNLKRSR